MRHSLERKTLVQVYGKNSFKKADDNRVPQMNTKLVRQSIRLLLSAVMLSVGLSTLPVQAQVTDAQVKALVEALRDAAQQRAPGNNGLVSDWQILPGNIPRWSRQCTGQQLTPAQFESNSAKAREILVCVMRDVMRDEYKASGNNESLAVQRAAAWWMTGDSNRYNSSPTNSYTQKVLSFYQQRRGNAQAQPSPTPPQKPASGSSSPPPATKPQPAPQPSTQQPSGQPTGSSSSPVQIADTQVGALVEALRLAAPQTGTQNNGLYSEWQVKAENIPRWSKQCLGKELTPTQFQNSPVTARGILVCVMRDVLNEQYTASNKDESVAVQRAAAWWMTGDPNQYNSGSTAPYTQKVLDFYRQSRFKFFSHI